MGSIRFLLAISVLVHHSRSSLFGFDFVGGPLGVELFFVISGFYIALILNEKYDFPGGLWAYGSNRALRIYPLYLLVFGVAVFAAPFFSASKALVVTTYYAHDNWANLPLWSKTYVGLSSLFLFGQEVSHFVGVDADGGVKFKLFGLNGNFLIAPAWSLSVELTFYVLAPFLVKNLLRLWLCFVVLLFARMAFGTLGYDPWVYRSTIAQMPLFLGGALAYHYREQLAGGGASSCSVS
ncbi:acyltransferase family protein [Ferrovibrio sp.]|uniref:acyltransferase family protein n=1 Tax=Ferrovibrio sp. TaxID=1917215 RepID=UPI003D27E471